MNARSIVAAEFRTAREATAAVDWFVNQRVDRDAIVVEVAGAGETQRAPRPGDNRRADLTWRVAVDVGRAPFDARTAVETMKRWGARGARITTSA